MKGGGNRLKSLKVYYHEYELYAWRAAKNFEVVFVELFCGLQYDFA